jgi:hypothetical protein
MNKLYKKTSTIISEVYCIDVDFFDYMDNAYYRGLNTLEFSSLQGAKDIKEELVALPYTKNMKGRLYAGFDNFKKDSFLADSFFVDTPGAVTGGVFKQDFLVYKKTRTVTTEYID